MEGEGWQVAVLKDIPPVKADWPSEWKSVRHHLGISAFGINAVSKGAGETLTPEHDELASNQQEVFFVHEGEATAILDGHEVIVRTGEIVAVEPRVKRSFVARVTPTTLLVVGSPVGAAYELPDWEQ